MMHLSHWKKRPIYYSFILSIGFILILLSQYITKPLFFIGALVLYSLIIVELYFNSNHFHEHIKTKTAKVYEFSHHRSIQISHHLLLPSLLYFSIIGFCYFNAYPGVYLILIAVFFSLFSILFENIYTYYHHNFSIHKSTSYVYDLISIFIIYFTVDSFLNFYNNENFDHNIIWFLFSLILLLLSLLLVIRHSITTETIISVFIFVGLVSGLFREVTLSNLSTMQSSILITSIYAIYNLVISNYSEKKFELEDIFEFGVILLLAVSILNIFGI